MAVNKSQLLSVLRDQIEQIPEESRVAGYQRELLNTLADIMGYEAAFQTKKTNIVVEVRGKCEALGDFLLKQGWGH